MENTQEDYKTTVDNLFDKIVNCSMRFYFNKKLRYIEEEKSIEISYENFRTEFRLYLEANI
ncbi:TPA: hypothetical protein DEP21_03870 [Patescibacteria group bacterium]|nr:hypothetical protein [Candidatus Gracilibacteria bacterium]